MQFLHGIYAAAKSSRMLSPTAARVIDLVKVAQDGRSVTVIPDTSEAMPSILAAAQAYAGLLDCDMTTNGCKPLRWSGPGLPLALYADSLARMDPQTRRVTTEEAARVLGELMMRPSRIYLYPVGTIDAFAALALDSFRRMDARNQNGDAGEPEAVAAYFGEAASADRERGMPVVRQVASIGTLEPAETRAGRAGAAFVGTVAGDEARNDTRH